MPGVKLNVDGLSIVCKGSFNPAIFSPAWLRSQGIVGDAEVAKPEVEVITRELASFRTGWLKVFVTPESLQVSSEEPAEFERVRDAAVAILRALPHTPVGALGINREVHFALDSADGFHAVGDTIVPKAPWEGVLEIPGMRSVTLWGARPGVQAGRIQVTVEPSAVVPRGVFVSHNDHYNLAQVLEHPVSRDDAWMVSDAEQIEVTPAKTEIAIETLQSDWGAAMNRAQVVVQRVYDQADER